MGVLNINEHLKHRRRITEENSDYTLVDSDDHDDGNVSEVETIQPPARPQRKQKPRNTNYYLKTPGNRPKGSRSGRRFDNTCYLLSLADHQDISEQEFPDIVNKTMTIFSTLFEDPQKMKIWNEFANLPEEDQLVYLRSQTSTTEESTSSEFVTSPDMSRVQPSQEELYAVAGKSYFNIDKKIRGIFQRKRFALGCLEFLEEELLSYLSSCPEAVIISNHPSSFDRMMVHGLCQYLKLLCASHNFNGKRLMEIQSKDTFQPPSISLSQYIKHKILRS